ncbi:ROK family transcriptional regulator [Cellulomonas hominis]|uniref:ROK family transcriptional regulator n=1 Tax=Cellulomonas hominis TaxID=156981 RepID=UPI001BA19D89|nr:ROK family transcriptional regulator [Cellulomonas hominis]VTR78460.1 N-acetylglucosamine repressor [Cellulomonas hominis]
MTREPDATPPTAVPGPWVPRGPAHPLALEVLLHGPVSRAELARRVGLSPGSVTRLTGPLVADGVLVEVPDTRPSRVGRPSQPLDVAADAHHFVGVKLTGDRAHAVLVTFRAEVVAATERPLADHRPGAVADLTAELVGWGTAQGLPVTGAGVSIGARVEDAAHVVRAPFLDWSDVPFLDLLRARTDVPVVLANDVDALTALTHWFGEGRGVPTFALVTIGAGVGYGLVANGRPVRAADAGLGLLGHHPLDPQGPVCPLGHRGCATAMLTTPSITAQVGLALGRPVGYAEVLGLAAAGEPAAVRVVGDSGRALGRLLAAAANFTLSPLVVLGGEGAGLATAAPDAVADGLHADRDPLAHDPALAVQPPDFGQWARGAAVEAIRRFVLGD